MSADTVEVRITATSAEAVAALKGAAAASHDAADAIKKDFAGVSAESHSAGGALSEFTHHLQTMRQEGRASSFMALQIQQMGIASKGAAQQVTGLVSAFALGGGLGLAIEGVKMLGEAIHENVEEHKRQAAEIAEVHNQLAESIAEAMKKVRESFEPNKTRTQAAWEEQVNLARQTFKKIKAEAEKELSEGGGVSDFLKYLGKHYGDFGLNNEKDLLPNEQRIMEQYKKAEEALRTLEAERPKRDQAAKEEDEHREREFTSRLLDLRAQREASLYAVTGDSLHKEEQLRLQHEAAIKKIELDQSLPENEKQRQIAMKQETYRLDLQAFQDAERAKNESARESTAQRVDAELRQIDQEHAQRVAGEAEFQLKLLDIREQQERAAFERRATTAAEEIAAFTQLEDQKLQIKRESLNAQLALEHLSEMEKQKLRNDEKLAVAEHEAKLSEIRDQARARSSKLLIAEMKEEMNAAQQVGDAFGNAFSQLATGAQDFAASMKDMAKTIVRALVDMAIKSLEAYAISAEGAAFFSQAGIPVIGPILGVGAAAGAGAFILGLIGSLPSAAGGVAIPRGINPVMQLHGGEHVIPEPIAQKYEDAIEGSGGGGGGDHYHFYGVMNVRDFVESGDFARAMREARRNGRIP